VILALVVAVASVFAGGLIGLAPDGARAVRYVRLSALVLALFVVFGELLPEAVEHLGWTSLFATVAGFGVPQLVRWLGARAGSLHRGESVELELEYWGLMLHRFGDGVALGAFGAMGHHHEGSPAGVVLAIALHSVPVVSVMVMAFVQHGNRRGAIFRTVGLAAVSVVGVLTAGLFPLEQVTHAAPWIDAVVAGLLLHVLTHAVKPHHSHAKADVGR